MAAASTGPTFLGIGAQKAGTTWLYKMLSLHPDIGLHPHKEAHFWDKRWPASAPIERYEAGFAAMPQPVRGEITPAYALLPESTIGVIHARYPDLKLLYLLRNPIERAWSHARMELAKRLRQGSAPDPAEQSRWLEQQLRSEGSIARGDYAACLRNWLAHFRRECFLIGIYEQDLAAPRDFLKASARHLGVAANFYDSVSDTVLSRVVLPERELLNLKQVGLPDQLPPAHSEMLWDIYSPRIRVLERLLGRNLSEIWTETHA